MVSERIEYGLESYRGCIMSYSDIDEIDAAGSVVTRRALAAHQPGRHPIRSLADLLERDVLVLPGTCLIGRDAFLDAGGFDPQLSGYEDDDFFVRIFLAGPIGFTERPLMQYRIYPESYRSSERMDRSRRNYFEKLVRTFPDDGREGRYWVRDKIAPRFSGLWLTRIRYGLRLKEPEIYRVAREGLRHTSGHGGFRLRLGGALLSRIPYGAARVLYNTPRFSYVVRLLFSMRSRPRKDRRPFLSFSSM